MSRPSITYTTISILAALMILILPSSHVSAEANLGQHVVREGETLYCLGRAYGVLPSAIAEANGLPAMAKLFVEQVLIIPAVQWAHIPAGPVCVAQFTSPYSSQAPATNTPTPTGTPSPGTATANYVVRRGDTLWRIGRSFGVSVSALKTANHLTSDLIYVGQILVIPDRVCDPAYPDVCIASSPPDLDCPQIPYVNFRVLGPDPHGFDGDGDGIGCEQ